MADETKKLTVDEALDEMMPKSKVEDIIQKRLRTSHEKRALMENRIQELEEQLSASQDASQQPQGMPPMPPMQGAQDPQPQGMPPMPPMQGAQESQPQGIPNAQAAPPNTPQTAQMPQENMLGGAQTPQDAPLTVGTYNQLHQEQQQHADNMRKQNNMHTKIQSMSQEDPEFKKLIEKEDGLKIDPVVAADVIDQYPQAAKKIIKKALTSEFENTKLQNAMLHGTYSGNWQHYKDWVTNLIGNKDAEHSGGYSMNESKDLAGISHATPGDSSRGVDEAIEKLAADG